MKAQPASAAAPSQALVQRGMQLFREGQVQESVECFDAALEKNPRIRPYLWQRGLSLYYLGYEDPILWEEAARQFRDDVAVNPADTEESIWAFMCEARLVGAAQARRQMLKVQSDPRKVMRAAYTSFLDGSDPSGIMDAISPAPNAHDLFYARLYMGLWHEAEGNDAAAKEAMLAAAETAYAQQSGDYMASLARVHCQQRGWILI